ncbi:uncharacterized protein [Physcomitrium patens]|uniref:Transmembrane protein n=1 Tax=Physcomitrium patens TaxID=3218 RepID=A0A2K1K6G1_PHYPA|nr:uncharacterized protein LOC112285448 [Physcomitrium patens]PNR49361.1 hypothetical protein PHYPA_011257 [Physcomitrium patens]|eukprot:XP_024382062.1 uncharacterized protein LOC112285448 [Physcomitrella patens]
MADVESTEVAQPEGFVERCEQQWQRAVEHAKAYPYVWASYVVTFGGLGIYGAWRFRELRRMENQVMQYQRELLKRVKQEETASSQALQQQRAAEVPAVDNSTRGKAPLEA